MASVTFRLGNTNKITVPAVTLGDQAAVGAYAPTTFTWELFDPTGTSIGSGTLAYVTGTTSDYAVDVAASVLAAQTDLTDGSLLIVFTKDTSVGKWRDIAKFRTRKFGQ